MLLILLLLVEGQDMSDTVGHLHDILHINKKDVWEWKDMFFPISAFNFYITGKDLFSLRKTRICQSQHEANKLHCVDEVKIYTGTLFLFIIIEAVLPLE